ncbi:FRG domain-containing protein [Microbulbifer sp. TRSA007]|uniref:FRG domain-containing protein n=1 Tax=Microbulbifer sp. TRSA007 TaxID=3243384 RepID=UPI004039DD7A
MDTDIFKNIPVWNGNTESFDILSDSNHGRIPTTRLESWKEFSELLEHNFFNRPKTQLVFRGHRRFDWGLMPTLARVPDSGIITRELADSQLDYFRHAVRGRLSDNALVLEGEEDELWSVGQHHGLLTPLLDWTHSPYVALFFAFAKEDSEEEKENPYRAIYILNKTFVANNKRCPDIRMFEPKKDDHGRLVNQAGLFTFSPYGATIESKLLDALVADNSPDKGLLTAEPESDSEGNILADAQAEIVAKYICKILIKNEDREGCMRHLRRMNVHHASLFPDLIGASEYCNLMVAEKYLEYEFDKSARRAENKVSGRTPEADVSELETAVIDDESKHFARILTKYSAQQVEPGRIQFASEHLAREIKPLLVVDWNERESAIAKIRSSIRISLRKYGYPSDNRDTAIAEIIEYLKAGIKQSESNRVDREILEETE